ncbi:MAG: Mov34/MPN/PAD-1 family protein [Phycisphaerae bacterium]|nr:Mov34/MPN/PAD-1 family protein [Phycisphaerae bacterium]
MTVESSSAPDTARIALGELRIAPFPVDCDWDPLRVHIAQEPYDAIMAHSKESDRIELCGVLVGEILKDELGPFLRVTHTIRGEHAKNEAVQVTLTQETWAHIHRVMDSEHDGRAIVGWYHTHPGFGIFLSQMDVFIHRHFFDLPWQIAFVVDPQSGDEGVFTWRDGAPTRTRRYWVGQVERMLITGAGTKGVDLATVLAALRTDVDAAKSELTWSRKRLRRLRLGYWVLFILIIALAAWIAGGIVWPAECRELMNRATDWARKLVETR